MSAARQTVRRVLPLTFGWEDLPKSISILGADSSIRLREPVPGVLAEVDGGWFLFDTGFNTPLVRDPHLYRRFHGHGVDAVLPDPEGDPLAAAFERVGVDPADVVGVAVSHLHNDHAGGLRWFAGRVPVHCQRRELDFGLSDHPRPEKCAIFRVDFDDPTIDWRLADGEVELAPGITAVPTFGHTPGHQSFVVDLPDGQGYVFAFDAADLQENIDDELSVGSLADGTAEESIEAIRRLKTIAAEKGYRLLPGHDPDVWPAFEAEFGIPALPSP
ncbi:MAG: N-acyl homoserine lactonase family protein [Actinobacteria bacterium]|nr:N-acyl homoserine lactonase family protein [Actinomycetota bacterium]